MAKQAKVTPTIAAARSGYADGYRGRPAASLDLDYQRAWRNGLAARVRRHRAIQSSGRR